MAKYVRFWSGTRIHLTESEAEHTYCNRKKTARMESVKPEKVNEESLCQLCLNTNRSPE